MAERLSVALIDDDEAILDSVQLYLGRRGFAVSCFRAAKPLLDALDAGTEFDCVVTDVSMPGMSGLALQQRLFSGLVCFRLSSSRVMAISIWPYRRSRLELSISSKNLSMIAASFKH